MKQNHLQFLQRQKEHCFKVAEKDVSNALTMSARTFIEKEPNYTFVAARLLLDSLRKEALSELNGQRTEATQEEMSTFIQNIFISLLKDQ